MRSIVAAFILVAIAAVPALAAQPADKGKLGATLEANLSEIETIGGVTVTVVTYDVTRNIPKNKDTIWVTTYCDGARVQDQPVLWGAYDSLVGYTQPLAVSGSCHGFVTVRPWQNKVLGDAEVFYEA